MTLRRGGKYIIKIARVRLILLRSSYYPQTIPLFLESHHGLITTFNRLKWAKSEKKKYDTKTDPLRFKRAMVSTKKQSFKRLICSWLTVIASIVLGHACISHLGSRSLAFLALVSNRLRWRRLLIIDRRNPRLVVDREYRDLDPERRHLNFVLQFQSHLSPPVVSLNMYQPYQILIPLFPQSRLYAVSLVVVASSTVSFSTCYGQRDAPHVIPDCLSNY